MLRKVPEKWNKNNKSVNLKREEIKVEKKLRNNRPSDKNIITSDPSSFGKRDLSYRILLLLLLLGFQISKGRLRKKCSFIRLSKGQWNPILR